MGRTINRVMVVEKLATNGGENRWERTYNNRGKNE